MLIDTTGKDQYVGAAGDFLVDDSATINPTATVLERILVRRIWEAAGGRRVRP